MRIVIALVTALALAGCASTTLQPPNTLTSIENDVTLLQAVLNAEAPVLAQVKGSAAAVAAANTAIADLNTVIADLKADGSVLGMQTAAQKVATILTTVLTATAGLALPPDLQTAFNEVPILVAGIEAAAGILVANAPTPDQQAQARGTLASMASAPAPAPAM